MNEEVGGTKIQRKPPPPQQMQQMPSQMQMQIPPQQMQMPQQMQQMPPQMQMQMPPQQMQQMQQIPQQMPRQPMQMLNHQKFSMDDKTFKYSLLVVLIFILLNSKIFWKQLTRLPLMGQVEPSMVALLVNSVLSGVIFYVISQFVFNK